MTRPAPTASRSDSTPAALVRDLAAGLVVGAVVVAASVSIGALVFAGVLEPYRAHGIVLALGGSAVAGLAIALASSLPGMTGQAQAVPAAIVAVMAASVAAGLPPAAPPVAGFITVVVLIGATTLATGGAFLLLGTFRWGSLVRYLPYPVVGGFVAGTGWVLLTGSVRVMSGVAPSAATLADLAAGDTWWRWLPGLAFGAVLAAVTHGRRSWALPALLAAGVALFFAVMVATGGSPSAWRDAGLLMGPFPAVDPLRPFDPADLQHVHWPALAQHAGGVATAVLLALMGLPLNIAGLGVAADRKLDVNRELRAAGLGNLLAGAWGAMTAYQSLGSNRLIQRVGSGRRTAGLATVAVVVAAIAAGPALLGYVPVPVVGGVLAYMAFGFLHEWLLGGWRTLPPLEYGILVLIVVVIAGAGLLPGVAVGLVLALLLFAVSYGRVDAVKHVLTGTEARSRMRWDAQEQRTLDRAGDARMVLQLQGFLFFGGAFALMERIERRLDTAPVDQVVLDFRRVTGIDATALAGLGALARLTAARGVGLVFTDLPTALARQLERRGPHPSRTPGLEVVATLDGALERSERRALAAATAEHDPFQTITERLDTLTDDDLELQDLIGHLERIEVRAGERLIANGAPQDAMYIVASGQVTAHLDGAGATPVRLETMRGGHLIGDVGFYTGAERTLSVVADEPTTLYRLTRPGLAALTASDPALAAAFHRLVVRNLAARLAHLTRVVEALQR